MKKLDAMTDHELVELYENGNDKAFDTLLFRHQKYVYSYILFLVKNEAVADDIFQDTFARAVVAIRGHRYQTTGRFSAWLIRIAHNLVVDQTRETDANNTVPQDEFSPKVMNDLRFSEETCETEMIHEQECHFLWHLLDYLPEVQREVVVLRFYEDLSFKEIAEKTGVSINTSLGRMRYALINLRKLVRQHQLSLVG